jgi:hypothetical protein
LKFLNRLKLFEEYQKSDRLIIKPYDIRCLSYPKSNTKILDTFHSLTNFLKYSKYFCPLAQGLLIGQLLSKLWSFSLILKLCAITDILGVLIELSFKFQRQSFVISEINKLLESTIKNISNVFNVAFGTSFALKFKQIILLLTV